MVGYKCMGDLGGVGRQRGCIGGVHISLYGNGGGIVSPGGVTTSVGNILTLVSLSVFDLPVLMVVNMLYLYPYFSLSLFSYPLFGGKPPH